jgi:hypothetical protein
MNKIIDEILIEWAYRVDDGMPNPKNREHISVLSEVLSDLGLLEIKNEFIKTLLNEDEKSEDERLKATFKNPVLNKIVTYQNKDGKEQKGLVGNLLSNPKDNPGRIAAEKLLPAEGTPQRDEINNELGGDDKSQQPKSSQMGGGEQPQQQMGSSLNPNTNDGKSYIDSLPDEDPAKKDTIPSEPKSNKDRVKRGKERAKEIYGEDVNGELLQKSKTSQQALEKGYVKGAEWVAPGNAGSNFNENMSNEAVLIMEKFTDADEAEVAAILFEKTRNSKLGKEQSSTTVQSPSKGDRGYIPSDIPTEERDLYRSCIIAARSGKSKYSRAKKGTEAAQTKVGFGSNTNSMSFGGTKTDLNNLQSEIQSANKIFVYDEETKEVYEIPKDVMMEWVKVSGGGENAADTVVLTKDENGNIIYDGWSDKKALSDIQGNSTLNDDYTKGIQRISKLKESGMVNADTAKMAESIITDSKKKSEEIEKNYAQAPVKEALYLKNYVDADRDRVAKFLKQQEEGYDKAGTENHIRTAMKYYGVTTHEELLDKLINEAENGKPSANRVKVISRMAIREKAYMKKNDMEIPAAFDTQSIISNARDEALKLQRDTIEKLNELEGTTSSGKTKRVGDLVGFSELVDFLHLDKIETPKGNDDHSTILKRNTQLAMAGVAIPPQNIKECLGVSDLSDLEDNFEVVTDEEIVKDVQTKKYTTGKVVYIYAIQKGGKRKFIGKKSYRSKSGVTGKTQTTIEWSKDMQECFDSK